MVEVWERLLIVCRNHEGKLMNLHSGALETKFSTKAVGGEEANTGFRSLSMVGATSRYFACLHAKKSLIYYFDIYKDECIYRQSLPAQLTTFTFTKDGQLLIGGSDTGHLYIWQVSSGQLVNVFTIHYGQVSILTLTEGDCSLLTASADGDIKLFLLSEICSRGSEPAPRKTFKGHISAITAVCDLQGGPYHPKCSLVTGSTDRFLMFWSWENDGCCGKILFPDRIFCIARSKLMDRVYVGSGDGGVFSVQVKAAYLQDFDSTKFVSLSRKDGWIGHAGAVHAMAITLDDEYLVTAAADGVRLWNINESVLIKAIPFPGIEISQLLLIPHMIAHTSLPKFAALQKASVQMVDSSIIFNDDPGTALSKLFDAATVKCCSAETLFSEDISKRFWMHQLHHLENFDEYQKLSYKADCEAEKRKFQGLSTWLRKAMYGSSSPDVYPNRDEDFNAVNTDLKMANISNIDLGLPFKENQG